jgi:hypothetical protein
VSRYQVDKVLYQVSHDPAARDAFRADPTRFLADRQLEEPERQALVDRDCGALYGLGAHPFLLLAFARVVWGDRPDWVGHYIQAISSLGYPDFAT